MPDNLKVWTTVGSAGTLNQADLAKVTLHQSIIQLGAELSNTGGAAAAPVPGGVLQNTIQAVVRYNVTPVDGLFLPGPFKYQLQVRFRNHITAKLMEVDLATGAEKQLLLLDSQSFPPNPNFQVQSVAPKKDSTVMDFVNKAYYVEATLIASALVVGHPAEISIIKVISSSDFTDVGSR